MDSPNFYADLHALSDFLQITQPNSFTPVPEDWWVFISDVVGSTQAIEEGRYKQVNTVGALSIVALLNLARDIDLPFVFGGDGASVLVPNSLRDQAEQAMLSAAQMAQQNFNLNLRVGAVSVPEILQQGYHIGIAKFQVSTYFQQAIFCGGGLCQAENLVKSKATEAHYKIKKRKWNQIIEGDFSGLECRWQDVPSPSEETLSLLVLATPKKDRIDGEQDKFQIYREVIEKINNIFGTERYRQPVSQAQLRLSLDPRRLKDEANLFTRGQGFLGRWWGLLFIEVQTLLAKIMMHFGLTWHGTNWGQYKEELATSTDYEKFDDMLRMLIAGTTVQRKTLQRYLEERHQTGILNYGLQVSDRALMTCLVFERHGWQVHFVDGADGGYALAAKQLKAQ